MPLRWVEPELFLEHQGIKIYHAYKDNDYNRCLGHWYTTDETEEPDFMFDVRDLPVPEGLSEGAHTAIIEHAIESKALALPEHQEYQSEDKPGDGVPETPLALAAYLENQGVECSQLDMLVHDAASHDASAVNNAGLEAQVQYLMEQHGYTSDYILSEMDGKE